MFNLTTFGARLRAVLPARRRAAPAGDTGRAGAAPAPSARAAAAPFVPSADLLPEEMQASTRRHDLVQDIRNTGGA